MAGKLFLIVVIILCSSSSIRTEPSYETSLAGRQGSQKPAKTFINPQATSYYELIRNSEVFVDNTLFIQEVFNRHGETEKPRFKCNSTLYMVPRNYGKTTNLDMLKSFLEIEVDKNGVPLPREKTTGYKLFHDGIVTFSQNKFMEILKYDKAEDPLNQPLLISKNKEFVNKYQGQVPVIFVSFSKVGLGSTDVGSIQDDIVLAFRNSFEQHIYLNNAFENKTVAEVLASADIEAFKELVDGKNVRYNAQQIASFVQSLSKILYQMYNRKPFFLLDDYDKPLFVILKSKTITEQEIETIFLYVENITAAIFKPENEYIGEAIATGYFKVESHFHRLGPFCRNIDITRGDHAIGEYFGFRLKEVRAMLSKRKVSDQMWEKVHLWYKVHNSSITQQYSYNPKSIISFLNDNGIGVHSASKADRDYVVELLEVQPTIRSSILLFISKHKRMTIRNIFLSAFYNFHIVGLKEMRDNKTMKMDWHTREIFYRYLFGRGYLSGVEDQTPFRYPPLVLTHLSNNEILADTIDWMTTYYEQYHKIADKYVIDAGVHLRRFIQNSTASPEELEKSLETVFKRGSPNWLNDTLYFKAMFNNVVLRLQRENLIELEVYYEKTLEADIVICDRVSQTGIAINLEGFRTPEDLLEEVLKYYQVFDTVTSFVRFIKYVGISVNPSRAVRILSRLVTNETRTTTPEPDPWEVDLSNVK